MKDELRILLLEDIVEEALLVERAIRRDKVAFVSKRVDAKDEFVQALKEFDPDIVLSDHALPQFNSIEALTICRQHNPAVPFILVTGAVSEEFAVACLKQGADDYVLKSNLSRLSSAILNALSQRDAEQKKLAAETELRLRNEKLLRSNSQLQKVNTELDNFVYNVSHNLRGPLSSILGVINVARMEEKFTDPQYFEMIEETIYRLDQTLKDILDYARNGRSEVRIEMLDAREIFFQSLESLAYLPGANNVQIFFDDTPDNRFASDRFRIGMIFHNLISNSIKYSDPQKPVRYIKVTVQSNTSVIIRFEDNGVGIRSDIVPRIFDMFFRGNEKSDGAGLGLYIVHEAVGKLQGHVDVTSKEKEGTVFTITLPKVTAEAR